MKKALLSLALFAIQFATFAQGKVTFGNDANHLAVFGAGVGGTYAPYAGLPIPQLGTPNDQMQYFTAQLWAGASAGSLTMQSTLTPAGLAGLADGRIGSQSVTLAGIPGGTTGFYQILIWETAYGSFGNAVANARPVGSTPVFSGPAGNFAPTPLTSFASWTAEPIVVGIPEPSTYALLALAATTVMLLRRRK